MRLSKFTGLFLIAIICLAVFLAKVSNLIRIYDDFEIYESPHPDPILKVIGDSPEPLFWFVQVSFHLKFMIIYGQLKLLIN